MTVLTAILSAFSLIATSQTNIGYGVTSLGGANNYGVIFAYNTATGADTVLHSFSGADGNGPYGNLMVAKNGLLYGTTTYGGTNDFGVIFSYDVATNNEAVLFNFDSATTGAYPLSTLIQADDGLLYGTTYSGGLNKYGVLFSFNPADNSYNALMNFDAKTGEYPIGKLLQASDGKLYGMTSAGGSYNNGVLFCYNILTATDTVLVNFNISTGSAPYGSLIEAEPGVLYGMTYGGGSYYKGVIFNYNIAGGKQKVLVNFNGSNGAYPFGTLLMGPGKTLYGLTFGGGDSNMGVIFSYTIEQEKEKALYSFHGADGSQAYGSLVFDSLGSRLYGMTHWGGNNNEGELFSFNIGTGNEYPELSFSSMKGTRPDGDILFINQGVPTAAPLVTELSKDMIVYPNPARNNVTIAFNNTEKHYIEVDDITGRVISKTECNDSRLILAVDNLAPGMYIIRLYNKKQQYVSSSRLIIE